MTKNMICNCCKEVTEHEFYHQDDDVELWQCTVCDTVDIV